MPQRWTPCAPRDSPMPRRSSPDRAADVPLKQAWTTPPDNPWDAYFEEVGEFSRDRSSLPGPRRRTDRALARLAPCADRPTQDSSGWFPWTPRTLHRETVLDTSRAYSNEVLARSHNRWRRAQPACGGLCGLCARAESRALPAADISFAVDGPLALVAADGACRFRGLPRGAVTASARVELPAYGYRLLGLRERPCDAQPLAEWWCGPRRVSADGKCAALTEGRLIVAEGSRQIEITVAPFKLSDPSGAATTEERCAGLDARDDRVRETPSIPSLRSSPNWLGPCGSGWLSVLPPLRDDCRRSSRHAAPDRNGQV